MAHLISRDDIVCRVKAMHSKSQCHLKFLSTPVFARKSPHLAFTSHTKVNYLSTPVGSTPTAKVGLGVPLPLLAPATATWVLPFAAYNIFLQNQIVYQRLTTKTYMGDTTDSTQGSQNPLYVATCAQLNFAENVPLVLGIALLAELNGANRTYINYALATLFTLRVCHAEFGLMIQNAVGPGRILGFLGTQAILGTLAGYTAYLVRNFWQIRRVES